MDAEAERSLVALKEQLEALDYREPLGIESAPLVQRLLQDLILSTTSYEELRQRAEQAEQDRDLVHNQTAALRKEYGRVTRENNQLHQQVIASAERLDELRTEWEGRDRKRSGELGDMRFLCEYQRNQIDKMQGEMALLMEKMHSMKLAAGANADIVNRREMEITSKLPPVEATATASADSTLVSDDSMVGRAPTGSLTDAIMVTELRRDIATLRGEAEAAARQAELLQRKVEARDAEISRLGKKLESGSDLERFSLENSIQTNQRIIETLNDRVDFLNQELAARDAQLQERDDAKVQLQAANRQIATLQTKVTQANKRSQALRLELQELTDMTKLLDGPVGDGDMALGSSVGVSASGDAAGSPVADTASSGVAAAVAAQRARKETLRGTLAALQAENLQLKREAERVAAMAEAYTADKQAFARTIAGLEASKAESEARATELRKQVLDLQGELREAQGTSVHLQAKVEAVSRDSDATQRALSRVQQDKSELSSRVATLQQDLTASKTALERAWNDNERLTGMLNEAQAQADALSRQAKALQDQRATLSSTADTAGDRERQAQRLVATLRVEKETVQHELDMVLVEVQRSHTVVAAAETAKQEAQQEVERLTSRVTALQEESTALQQQVADKVNVCRELQEKLVELREVRHLREAGADLQQQVEKYHARAQEWEQKAMAHVQTIARLEDRVSELSSQSAAVATNVDAARDEARLARQQLAAATRELEDRDATVRTLEAQHAHTKRLLEQSHSTSKAHRESSTVRQQEVDAARAAEAEAKDSADAARRRVATLEASLDSARVSIEDHAERLALKSQHVDDLEQQLQQARGRMQEAERMRVRAEAAAAEAERRRAQATGERRTAETEVRHMRLRLEQQTQQLSQVKTLAMQLEGGRDIQDEKLKQREAALAAAQRDAREARSALEAARKASNDREEEVVGLQRALAQLDEERDMLQRALDRRCEDVAQEQTIVKGLRAELETAAAAYRDVKKVLEDHREALASKEADVVALTSHLESAQASAAEALRVTVARQQEVQAASADLASMTRENQVVSAECMQLQVQLRNQTKMVDELKTSNARTQRTVDELNRRYNELMASYRAVCDERSRLDTQMETTRTTSVQLQAQAETQARELGTLQARLAAAEDARAAAEQDARGAEAQLESVSRELAAVRGDLAVAAAQHQSLEHSMSATKDAETRLHSAHDKLRRNMLAAQADAEAARRSATVANSERAALVAKVELLTKQVASMETMLAKARDARARAELRESQSHVEVSRLRAEHDTTRSSPVPSPLPSPRAAATGSASGAGLGPGVDAATAAAFAAQHTELDGLRHELRVALGVGMSTASRDGEQEAGEVGYLSAQLRAVKLRCTELESHVRRQAALIEVLKGRRRKVQQFATRYEQRLDGTRGDVATLTSSAIRQAVHTRVSSTFRVTSSSSTTASPGLPGGPRTGSPALRGTAPTALPALPPVPPGAALTASQLAGTTTDTASSPPAAASGGDEGAGVGAGNAAAPSTDE